MEKKNNEKLSNKEILKNAKKINSDKKKSITAKQKKIAVISAIVVILIIVILIVVMLFLSNLKYKPYERYEEKMRIYGFDLMYDNKSCKTSEKVNKSEALKLVISASLNIDDISNMTSENNDYNNSIWVNYALSRNIIDEKMDSEVASSKATYIEVINYFEKSKEKLLNNEEKKDSEKTTNDIAKYTIEEQIYIKDMLENNIIELFSQNLDGKEYIFKGKLNQIVVNFVEKYNTIVMQGEKLNINPQKNPDNIKEFPYIVTNIDKKTYEYSTINKEVDIGGYTASEIYRYKKDSYEEIKNISESFFYNMLNVDYRTINKDEYRENLERNIVYKQNDKQIDRYIDYVKSNEIVISGKATALLPIFYFDGIDYFLRLKINIKIENAKVKENLIYLDFLDVFPEVYNKDELEFFVDYPLTEVIGNSNMYLKIANLYNCILDKNSCAIMKQIENLEEN